MNSLRGSLKKYHKYRGYSLLEIIIVLVFIGMIMATTATYISKSVDEKTRRIVAEAVTQEIYGILQFVNADSIVASVNNQTRKINSPLYQTAAGSVFVDNNPALVGIVNNPVYLAHPADSLDAAAQTVSPFIARKFSDDLTDPLDAPLPTGIFSHSLRWSQSIWAQNSVRDRFTDSGCAGVAGNVLFFEQFLTCNEAPVLGDSELSIPVVDFVSSQGTVSRTGAATDTAVAIDRVDIYVQFTPMDNKPARIMQVFSPLISAFQAKKISPDTESVYLVERARGSAADNWVFTTKSGAAHNDATPVGDLITFSEIPAHLERLRDTQIYALRFTFDGGGDYLRTDGLNSTTKVCWNTERGVAGPCLTASSDDTLVLKQRQNPDEFASLQADSVISAGSRTDANGNVDMEYYTVPRIQYAAFHNDGNAIGPYFKGGANGQDMCTDAGCGAGPSAADLSQIANGAISVPVQDCPQGVVNGAGTRVPMNPRLSASVSSVVSGIRKDADGNLDPTPMIGDIFSNQNSNLNTLNNSNLAINRLGAAVLQINQAADNTWRVSAMIASEDIAMNGRSWIYFNPSWLSVTLTSWCSSEPQN